jgi:hypothetical protein
MLSLGAPEGATEHVGDAVAPSGAPTVVVPGAIVLIDDVIS